MVFHMKPLDGTDTSIINVTHTSMAIQTRQFTPSTFSRDGFMGFISIRMDTPFVLNDYQSDQIIYMERNTIEFYDFLWLDTSQISAFFFGTRLEKYFPTETWMGQKDIVESERSDRDIYSCAIVQSRSYLETIWTLTSLDLYLGLVGGFTSIIWTLFSILIGPYEDFKF